MTAAVAPQSAGPSFGYTYEPPAGHKTHFCVSCQFPVAVYGRLYPCLHTYCLGCATDMSTCYV